MRVQINAGGREVVIDCADTNVSVKDIAGEALAVWAATSGAERPSDGPAFGLAAVERRERNVDPVGGWAVKA